MSGQITKNPSSFNIKGNILNKELSNPTSSSVFSATKSILTLSTPVIVSGILITPIKSVYHA